MGRRIVGAACTSLILVGLVTGASPSSASCASDSGPDLASGVWVLSGQRQPRWPLNLLSGVSSSVDADFVEGDRYVVGASRQFQTDACSVAEIGSALVRVPGRPTTVRPPTATGSQGADPPIGPAGQTLTVLGPFAVVWAVIILVGRRRSRSAPASGRPEAPRP